MVDIKEVLGNNIKHYRQLKGLSQDELSEMLDISQQSLSKIERGKNFLTSETLEKIPTILGVNIYELFIYDNEYTCDNIIEDIERHLNTLISNPKKLKFIHRIVKQITNL